MKITSIVSIFVCLLFLGNAIAAQDVANACAAFAAHAASALLAVCAWSKDAGRTRKNAFPTIVASVFASSLAAMIVADKNAAPQWASLAASALTSWVVVATDDKAGRAANMFLMFAALPTIGAAIYAFAHDTHAFVGVIPALAVICAIPFERASAAREVTVNSAEFIAPTQDADAQRRTQDAQRRTPGRSAASIMAQRSADAQRRTQDAQRRTPTQRY